MDFRPKSQTERETMLADASTMLREYAADRWPTLNHKGRMSRLAGALNWTFRRVRSVYQAEDTARLRADELRQIQELKRQEVANEYRVLEARIAALEALFAVGDEDFGREHMAALRELARQQGR